MRTTSAARLLTGALVTAALATGSAQTRATWPADTPRVPFEKITLSNGLDVILSEDHRLPLVAVNLWYHVGPANEEPGRTGFAHLFEHLMFQGSKHIPPDSHFQILEAAGATDANATTDYDRTNYFETMPSNQLELALWLESDRMGYLPDAINQREFANQQDVVRNERRQRTENRPYGMADEVLVQLLYPEGHPYHAVIIGSHADIQAATLEDARQFFKRYYAPNNASLAIVGDFDRTEVKRLVDKYFGSLRRGPAVPPISVRTPPITSERRRVIPDRIELPRVSMAWITSPIFKPGDADAVIAADILGGGASSRLYKRLVYERQIAQDVYAYQQSLLLGSSFVIAATARPGHTAAELEAAIDEELDKLRAAPPDAAELERGRNTIETRLIQRLEAIGGGGGLANRLNLYQHFLGTPDYLQQDIARYRAVTTASVHSFVKQQLQRSARAVVHSVPGTPEIVPGPQAPSSTGTSAAHGTESINPDQPWRSEIPKPRPANAFRAAAPDTFQLPNGLTLILSLRRGLPVVSANLVVKSGSGANPVDKPGLANFTVAMLEQGTSSRSALQIADEAARLGATLTTDSTMDASTIGARSLKKNFPAALALVADIVQRPSFPADEIDRERAARLGQLVQQRENPGTLAGVVVASALYGEGHPYGFTELGTEASVKAITREMMNGFWRQHFVPNNAALVVSGDMTLPELRSLAEKAFGQWKRGPLEPSRPGVPATTPSRVIIVDRPGAPQSQLRIVTTGIARSSPDFAAVQVMNAALGGLFSSRINMNLREQHGYSYGAYSQFIARRSTGPFMVYGAVRTDVTAASVSEVLKEIRGIGEKPLSSEELRKAKDALIRSLPGAFETTVDTIRSYSTIYTYDLGVGYFSGYADRIEAVTAEQALATARKYLIPERLIAIVVGDRTKIEPELRKLDLGVVEIRDAEGRSVS